MRDKANWCVKRTLAKRTVRARTCCISACLLSAHRTASRAGYCLRTPGERGGVVWGPGQPRPTPSPPPHQKRFPPAKNEMYQRGRKFEANFRYTNFFFSL